MEMPWGKHRGKAVADLPDVYVCWLAGNGPRHERDVPLFVELRREAVRRRQQQAEERARLNALVDAQVRQGSV